MKLSHVLVVVVLTAFLSIYGTFLIIKKNYANEESESDRSQLENSRSISKVDEVEAFVSIVDIYFGWENPTYSKMIDEWNTGDEPFVDNLVQEVIQQMSHQKIIADEKESSIMITPERISTLLQMVEENKDSFNYSEKYVEILKRWKQDDFSTVDQDYNEMWFIQGTKQGGIATGIASKEQEQDYIFRVFGIPVEKQN